MLVSKTKLPDSKTKESKKLIQISESLVDISGSSSKKQPTALDFPVTHANPNVSFALLRRLPAQVAGWIRIRATLVKRSLPQRTTSGPVLSAINTQAPQQLNPSSGNTALDISSMASARRVWVEIRGGVLVVCPNGEFSFKNCIDDESIDMTISAISLHGAEFELTKGKEKDIVFTVCRPDDRIKCWLGFDNQKEFEPWLRPLTDGLQQGTVSENDINLIQQIGSGGMGKVYSVSIKAGDLNDNGKPVVYAMKAVEKSGFIQNQSAFRRAMEERAILELVKYHPFVLSLKYSFETWDKFFLIMDMCSSGDLFDCLHERRAVLEEETARLLAAEIVLGLEHLHSIHVLYRDLKPENILLDESGHIRLADFGLSRLLESSLSRTKTICGTREYIAPEMLRGPYGYSVDFWALGILLYHVLSGRTPFASNDPQEILRLIKEENINWSVLKITDSTKDFIKLLLNKDPKVRIKDPRNPFLALKNHPYFESIDWDKLYRREYRGPFADYCEKKQQEKKKKTSMDELRRSLDIGDDQLRAIVAKARDNQSSDTMGKDSTRKASKKTSGRVGIRSSSNLDTNVNNMYSKVEGFAFDYREKQELSFSSILVTKSKTSGVTSFFNKIIKR